MSLPRRFAMSAAALLLAPAFLTACGGDDAAESAAEKAIENASGGDADVDIDDDGNVKIETSDGTFTSGQDLPEGFPTDEVPLIDGDIQMGMSGSDMGSDGGFAVVVTSDLDVDAATEEAISLLTDAGFETTEDANSGFGAGLLSSPKWEVLLIATDSGGSTQVQYVVSPAS
ncbi:MAG: hypothetical protein F2667_01750 [Actinobacteria bacterium]|uniref:Unannotated protein n=1 Tax=freshwater metagenome TaxID=449393 RepID=A0A6J6NZL3_9ZZZZ|nr:hypothetical protein [Actinomycetota bacterium]